MSAQLLREKYNSEFAGMRKYSSVRAWAILGSYVLQILFAVSAGGFLLLQAFSWPLLLAAACFAFFVGTRLRGLNNIIHECSHATFSINRGVNTAIGKFCAVVLFSSFSEYRRTHLSHHAHLGDYDSDLDLQSIENLKLHDPLSSRVIFRHLLTPLLGRHIPYYLKLDFSARDGSAWLWAKAALLFTIATLTIFFPITLVVFLILPFAFVYTALNYWADCIDHAGILLTNDDLYASRNALAPRLIRPLLFPRSDCFHLVHHLFPHIPSQHLEASHNTLVLEPSYSGSKNAVSARDLRKVSDPEILLQAD